jgi:hypothetical protein
MVQPEYSEETFPSLTFLTKRSTGTDLGLNKGLCCERLEDHYRSDGR